MACFLPARILHPQPLFPFSFFLFPSSRRDYCGVTPFVFFLPPGCPETGRPSGVVKGDDLFVLHGLVLRLMGGNALDVFHFVRFFTAGYSKWTLDVCDVSLRLATPSPVPLSGVKQFNAVCECASGGCSSVARTNAFVARRANVFLRQLSAERMATSTRLVC